MFSNKIFTHLPSIFIKLELHERVFRRPKKPAHVLCRGERNPAFLVRRSYRWPDHNRRLSLDSGRPKTRPPRIGRDGHRRKRASVKRRHDAAATYRVNWHVPQIDVIDVTVAVVLARIEEPPVNSHAATARQRQKQRRRQNQADEKDEAAGAALLVRVVELAAVLRAVADQRLEENT